MMGFSTKISECTLPGNLSPKGPGTRNTKKSQNHACNIPLPLLRSFSTFQYACHKRKDRFASGVGSEKGRWVDCMIVGIYQRLCGNVKAVICHSLLIPPKIVFMNITILCK